MIDRDIPQQRANQIVDISNWPVHEEYEVFPVGARDKSLRICPADTAPEFCIPNHKYLFKEAIKSAKDPRKDRHPDQYWAEVIAYKIGGLMGLSIPPAFVAINSDTGEPGTIIEWFTGYDPNVKERFAPGGDYMQASIKGYDRDKGRQHNLTTIMTFSRALSQHASLSHNWKEYWGMCLCFDALIGNTDRHQENWGVIWEDSTNSVRLTPFFDNGTSLGHELFQDRITQCLTDDNMLNAYIRRGRHHMKWHIDDNKRLPLIDGVAKYCEKYPNVAPLLAKHLSWNDDELETILNELTTFTIKSPLTTERAAFIHKLTCFRKELLLEVINEHLP